MMVAQDGRSWAAAAGTVLMVMVLFTVAGVGVAEVAAVSRAGNCG